MHSHNSMQIRNDKGAGRRHATLPVCFLPGTWCSVLPRSALFHPGVLPEESPDEECHCTGPHPPWAHTNKTKQVYWCSVTHALDPDAELSILSFFSESTADTDGSTLGHNRLLVSANWYDSLKHSSHAQFRQHNRVYITCVWWELMSNWLVMLMSHCLACLKSVKPTLHEPSTT